MAKTLNVRPDPRFSIRHPETKKQLPDEGDQVPDTPYWRGLIRTGQVIDLDAARHAEEALARAAEVDPELARVRDELDASEKALLDTTTELDSSKKRVDDLVVEVEKHRKKGKGKG